MKKSVLFLVAAAILFGGGCSRKHNESSFPQPDENTAVEAAEKVGSCESTDETLSEEEEAANDPSKNISKKKIAGFLDDDGVEDILETRTAYWFAENDGCEVLEFSVAVKIKLMNEDGSVKKEYSFIDDYSFCDDEIDGSIGYSIDDGRISRTFIYGAHSYRTYETWFYQYEAEMDNWILKNAHAEINPLHENLVKDKVLNDEKICLYDKESGKFLWGWHF